MLLPYHMFFSFFIGFADAVIIDQQTGGKCSLAVTSTFTKILEVFPKYLHISTTEFLSSCTFMPLRQNYILASSNCIMKSLNFQIVNQKSERLFFVTTGHCVVDARNLNLAFLELLQSSLHQLRNNEMIFFLTFTAVQFGCIPKKFTKKGR